MSTPDPTTPNGVPSPGVALAGARVPGAPTVPDWDPRTLTTLVGRLANELFAAPPASPDASGVLPAPPAAESPLQAPAPAQQASAPGLHAHAPAIATATPSIAPNAITTPPAPPESTVSPTPSPFSAPLRFDALSRPDVPTASGAPRVAPVSSASPSPVPSASPWDSQALTAMVGQLANALFTAPPQVEGTSDPSALPTDLAPAIATPPIPLHEPASPFAAPLRFDALGAPDLAAPDLATPAPATAEVPRDEAGLYWLAPPAPAPQATPTIAVEQPGPAAAPRPSSALFDAHAVRREFPVLQERVHGKPLVWLDNAATTQKPRAVIDRISRFYERENSNIHRAAHTLAARATDAYESARETVRKFLNASTTREVVFVRGATEGINLVAQSWGRRNISAGDEIVITWLEHHANIVPWQQLAAERGAKLRVAPVDDTGQIILEEYEKLLGPRTRLVSMSQVSNALGTVTPAKVMIELAHRHGAVVLLDGAQAVSHMAVDVQQLDCDFYVFSGHKVFAPTGIGVVFGKQALLDAMPPWQGGGNMIQDVSFDGTIYQPAPARFEAGTGNIADAVGLGAALEWLTSVGLPNVARHEHDLLVYATERLVTVPGLTMIGTAPGKAGVLSFVLAGQKTEEVGGLLDRDGIAVRSGHHCAQPILRRFGLAATVRASLAPYNTTEDIDALVAALRRLQAGHVPRPGSASS